MSRDRAPKTMKAAARRRAAALVHRRRVAEQVERLLAALRRKVRGSGATLTELEGILDWQRGYLSQLLRGAIYLKANHLFALAIAARFDAATVLAEAFGSGPVSASGSVSVLAASGAERSAADDARRRLRADLEELIGRWLAAERPESIGATRNSGRNSGLAPAGIHAGDTVALAEYIRRQAEGTTERLRTLLRRTIVDHEISLHDLSAELGWGRGTIYTALSQRVQLTFNRLLEVLSGLDVDAGEFFSRFFALERGEESEGEGQPAVLSPEVMGTLRKLLDSLVTELDPPAAESPPDAESRLEGPSDEGADNLDNPTEQGPDDLDDDSR